MVWRAGIQLKSSRFVTVDGLISIDTKSMRDSSIEKLTDFNNFHLSLHERLSFVGAKEIVSLSSDEIEYVQISQS